jgi:hypothetical protein
MQGSANQLHLIQAPERWALLRPGEARRQQRGAIFCPHDMEHSGDHDTCVQDVRLPLRHRQGQRQVD